MSKGRHRERCLSAKGAECIVCGSRENVVAHHIDGNRNNNELSNLAPVCRSCHAKIHSSGPELAEWSERLGPPRGNSAVGVTEELADELYQRKGRGESYEDIIWELIEKADAFDEEDGAE